MRDFTIIGLTGPTGSGKSTAAKFFEELGYVVIDADDIARAAMKSGSGCLRQVCAAFGEDIVGENGELDRKKLAKRAFSSKENTKLLNDITHPWIFLRVLEICRENIDQGKRKFVFDAPLLFESNSDIMCDCTVSMTAPKKIRAERLKKRDGIGEEQIEERMAAQHGDEFYVGRSDFVIDGSAELEKIKMKIREITDNFL